MVVNRDVIFQFLGNSKNFGSRNSGLSNYRVFVISEPQGSVKKQKVNIISVSYVTSVGDSSFTVAKYIESLQEVKKLIEKTFGVETEFKDSDQKRKLYIKIPSQSNIPVIIDFEYKNISKSGKTENEGQRYEGEIIEKLRQNGYTSQTKAEEVNKNQDVTVTVNGVSAGIEIKSNWKAAFGQARLEYVGNRWKLKDTASDVFKKLVDNSKLIDWINDRWYIGNSPYTPKTNPDKDDQLMLGGGTGYFTSIETIYIKDYYSNSDYIHIRDKGFYKIGMNNPLKIESRLLTNFEPRSAKARVRVKAIGSGKYDYVIEMYLGSLSESVNRQGLDGDLSFLGTP
jgi:hypothetical protein